MQHRTAAISSPRIVLIDAGSYLWAFGFIRQFVNSEPLRGMMLVMVDTDADALDLVFRAL